VKNIKKRNETDTIDWILTC